MVAPAWSMLDPESILALLTPEAKPPQSVQVAAGVPSIEIASVSMMTAVRSMVERAHANGGLALTKAGALSRADVRAAFDAADWPDYDKATVLAVNKVLNEGDVLPVEFARIVASQAKLLRTYKGRLLTSKLSLTLIRPENAEQLFRLLFETAFWRINLAYFDRMPSERWPQAHVGLVLWSLSVAAHHWSSPEDLLTACTMSDDGLASAASDFPAFAMVTRVLRPLTWFGLLECREATDPAVPRWQQPRLYRKSHLFNKVFTFDVTIDVRKESLQ